IRVSLPNHANSRPRVGSLPGVLANQRSAAKEVVRSVECSPCLVPSRCSASSLFNDCSNEVENNLLHQFKCHLLGSHPSLPGLVTSSALDGGCKLSSADSINVQRGASCFTAIARNTNLHYIQQRCANLAVLQVDFDAARFEGLVE